MGDLHAVFVRIACQKASLCEVDACASPLACPCSTLLDMERPALGRIRPDKIGGPADVEAAWSMYTGPHGSPVRTQGSEGVEYRVGHREGLGIQVASVAWLLLLPRRCMPLSPLPVTSTRGKGETRVRRWGVISTHGWPGT